MNDDQVLLDLPAAVAYLFSAYRKPLDDTTGLVYEHQLSEVPFALVRAAVLQAPQHRRFLPSISELKEDCEAIRLELSKSIAWEPCVACRDTRPGWDVVVDPGGVKRYTRCACWLAHQASLEQAGVPIQPVVALLEAPGEDA